MKFKEYKYERPNIEKIKEDINNLLSKFKNANNVEEQNKVIKEINLIRNNFETMSQLVEIRYTIDTRDKFYEKENEYFDEIKPIYEGIVFNFYKELINSKFKEKLQDKWGKQLFRLAELTLKTFDESIIPDLQEENKLSSEYSKLIASAQILFEGKIRNLADMRPFMESKDRDTRKSAWEAYTNFFVEHEDEIDNIYDKMVKVRHGIAKKLGFNNFIELGYARMQRTDYDANMVAEYRKQVLKDLVPLANKLRERQRERLGYNSLKYYDESLKFLTGNPIPKGDSQWIINNGKKMYSELSKETKEFFEYMIDNELLDLISKEGKVSGGYCTYIPDYKSPFIFSNFNGTAGDVDVLTHEAGHAFQVYTSRHMETPEYNFPTYEACEIHSMSMEFFTYPWMKYFFKEDTLKYKFYHISEAILFIPYGVTVDEFQHWVYANPLATPKERKDAWREIEKKYLPYKDYSENDFLNRGGFWFKQGHIFNSPFYYIDYTLAQVCAFQFYLKSLENYDKAWKDYYTLCKEGGSKSFLELVEIAGLQNPFIEGTIKSVIDNLNTILQEIDDKSL